VEGIFFGIRSLRRRAFITVLAGAAAWPLAGHAQQPERVRRVGVLMAFTENDPSTQAWLRAFAQALDGLAWVEGKSIRIDYRFAAGDPGLFKTYAAELVGLSPDAILASTTPAVAALRQQTRTIPIVFVFVVDPVGQGFAQSLARPGGNITGFSSYDAPAVGKWLQLLKEVAPSVARVAVIFNPDTTVPTLLGLFSSAIEAAARSVGTTVTLAPVHDDAGIEEAIAAEAREPGGGLVCLPDSFNITHRDVIIAVAARHSLPLISTIEFPRAGGLMSYWFDPIDLYVQAASYIDHILKGANPAELPVQQPTKYSLIINLKTANALGLTVPPAVLALADEVIE
jgi:putative ABC transport system substrate-binding protein